MLYHAAFQMRLLRENAALSEKIRFYREKSNMNCDMLAGQIGTSRYTVMRYESGETEPSLSDLQRMAEVFAIEPDKLYDDYYRFLAYPYPLKIREVRKSNKLTQRELAAALAVSTTTVKRWESGEHTVTREMWGALVKQKFGVPEQSAMPDGACKNG